MRKYVLQLTSGAMIPVTQQQKNEIAKTMAENSALEKSKQKKAYAFSDTGEIVILSSISSIILAERGMAAQDDKLARSGKHRCKYGQIHSHQDGELCRCGTSKSVSNPFSLFAEKLNESQRNRMSAIISKVDQSIQTLTPGLEKDRLGGI